LDEFDIVEKCYLYIAMCMYSVKAAITVTNKLLGNQDIPLALVLNNIERCYTRDFVV
jgi:hypothetical protein